MLIALLTPGDWHLYVMRPAYLAITGYLIGFLGQQRVLFEEQIRELETAAERQSIARFLHDGYAQGLAGINLRLETCRHLLRHERHAEALQEVTELQTGVAREFDDVRTYIRSLAAVADAGPHETAFIANPTCHLRAVVTARGAVLEQVLQVALEGLRNMRRHAQRAPERSTWRRTSARCASPSRTTASASTAMRRRRGRSRRASPNAAVAWRSRARDARAPTSRSSFPWRRVRIMATRIVLADDHALFRQGLRSLLRQQPELEVVAEVERASDLLTTLAATPCDLLLLDLQMERWMVNDIENLAGVTRVIVLTASEKIEDRLAAIRLGARAIVQKRFAVETLMEAIRSVQEGLVWMPATLQAELASQLRSAPGVKLTARESEIVRCCRPRHAERRDRRALQDQRGDGEDAHQQHLSEARRSATVSSSRGMRFARVFEPEGIADRVALRPEPTRRTRRSMP